MNNSGKKSDDDRKLGKDEIIRGYRSYFTVLEGSRSFATEFFKAFVFKQSIEKDKTKLTISPLFTNNVKVGFIVAKKKIKRAVLRNRIRRLLKESYRLNKNQLDKFPHKVSIIFSLTDNGYRLFNQNPDLKFSEIESEMTSLISKINKNLNNR